MTSPLAPALTMGVISGKTSPKLLTREGRKTVLFSLSVELIDV